MDIDKIWASLFALPAIALTWLIRTVLTNNKKIALLEAEIARWNDDRKELRADIKRLLERK